MEGTRPDFYELLNQARGLRAEVAANENHIRRVLPPLATSKTPMMSSLDTAAANTKAALILGSKGFDLPSVSQRIEQMDAENLFKTVEEETLFLEPELSITKYHERAVAKIIEDNEKKTIASIEEQLIERLMSRWDEKKQEIIDSMEMALAPEYPKLCITPTQEALTMTYRLNPSDNLSDTEIFFAKVIHAYVKDKVNNCWNKDLIEELSDVCGLTDNNNIIEIWKMFRSVARFSESSRSVLNVLSSLSSSMECLKLIVKQSRTFLEKEFRKHLIDTVYSDLSVASLGGVPGVYPLVRAYLTVIGVQRNRDTCYLYDDGAIEDKPAWMFVYYCLRCGDVNAAIYAAESANLSDIIQILNELRLSADDVVVSPERRDRIKLIYKRSVNRCYDPYKKVVYCILGHCDPSENHRQVADNIEDFLWIKLFQVEFERSSSPESLFICDLQKEISVVLGEKYFLSGDQTPYVYLQCLLLTGQFEYAVELMCRYQHLTPHAVHMAIALQQLNLLHISPKVNSTLLSPSENPDFMTLNIHKLIRTYVKRFGIKNIEAVFDYFYLFADCIFDDSQCCNYFALAVSDYVKKYELIDEAFGRMKSDGIRSHGLIDNYTDRPNEIIDFVAVDFENSGKYIQAVILYHLADDHERMIMLLNQLLGSVLNTSSDGKESKRKEILLVADEIYQRIIKVGHNSPNNEAVHEMTLMLDLANFFDLYLKGKYEKAVECIKQLPILPFHLENVEEKVMAFSSLPTQIKLSIGSIIAVTAECLQKSYEMSKPKNSPSTTGTSGTTTTRFTDINNFVISLKEQANALIQYAASVPFHIHCSVNVKLLRLSSITTK